MTDCGPMDQPMKGVAIPDAPPVPATAPATHITTLANGAKIASEDTLGASMAVGMYISAGSKNENPFTVGASHLLERMAFRATHNRTSFRVTREAEVIGANLLVGRKTKDAGHDSPERPPYPRGVGEGFHLSSRLASEPR